MRRRESKPLAGEAKAVLRAGSDAESAKAIRTVEEYYRQFAEMGPVTPSGYHVVLPVTKRTNPFDHPCAERPRA